MTKLVAWIEKTMMLAPDVQAKIVLSFAVIFGLWLVRKLVITLARKKSEDVHFRYRLRKTSTYITVSLGVLFVGRVWFSGFSSLATFFGLLSAGLAIALKDLVSNMAGWAFIIFKRPLEVGDRIQIGEYAGDVIDLRLFQFTLMEIGNWVDADQSTGRIIHIPNGMVLSSVLANYSKGFQYIWNEIPVLITFESDWEKAKEILLAVINKHSEHLSEEAQRRVKQAARKFLIFYSKLTPTVYTRVKDSGVLLTIRYLCEPQQRRGSEQSIWESVLREFAKVDNIDFAYPTNRFYNRAVEGR